MGRVATAEEIENPNQFVIPATLGDPEKQQPNLDLIGDEEDDEFNLSDDPAIVAMQEQLSKMETSASEDRQLMTSAILQMAQKPAQQTQQQTQSDQGLNLKDLPDPVEKREEFNDELGKRINTFISTTQQNFESRVNANSSTQTSLKDLESRFQRDHPQLAKKGLVFQAALTQEINKIKGRGMDAQQFVFSNPDKFLTDVAESMKDELGLTDEDLEESADELTPARNLVRKSKLPRRAKGVRGGSIATIGKTKKSKQTGPTGFINDLKRLQLEMGII